MKIAYIGNFSASEWTTENDVRKAFEHLGHEVIKLQENETDIYTIRQEALHSDLLLITGTWDAIDLGDWLDLMYELADNGIPTATLHLDTFWPTKRGGRKWWREAMFHTAYIATADGDWQDKWQLLGKNHIWLPPAVRHDAAHFGEFREEYACDVAFVGSNGRGYHEDVWPYRKELVDNLREMCKRNGWSFKNPGGDDPKIDRGEDMNDFYASARVTIGDSLCLKKEEAKYWSDRVPECLGRGGRLIMPQIDALDEIYGGRLPMYPWGDFQTLEGMISRTLEQEENFPEEERLLQRTVAKYDTYVNRAETILQTVGVKEKVHV